MKKSLIVLLLLCAWQLNAQTFTSIPAINRSNMVSVPTTPEAAKFQQYIDVPVNISSGIPDIKVPVFAFELKDFNWNIDLSYYAGGNKVADIAGYTGLGWTLNYGGMISAKMIGQFDLLANNASNTLRRDLDVFAYGQSGICTYANQTDIAIAELASDGFTSNYLPDVYYLNTNNFSTKFFLNADNQLSTMPASDIRINYSIDGGDWTVIDENGNKYYFEQMGSNNINMGWCGGASYAPTFIYYLTRIETYQGETLTFNYTSLNYTYQTTDNEVKYVMPPYPNNSPCMAWASAPIGEGSFSLPPSRTCPVYGSVSEKLIQSITCSNGTSVSFTYSSRNDLLAGQKLDKIEVYNNSTGTNILKKTTLLNYAYFGSGSSPDDLRLKLENVSHKAINENKFLRYAFEYNPTQLPNRLAKGIDWGGYYNGPSNTSLIPPAANRDSYLETTKACILEKIFYPTGGYSQYTYELNDLVGGLRVASTESFDRVSDKTIKKTYTYASHYIEGYQLTDEYRAYFMYRQGDNTASQLVDCYATKYSSQPSSASQYGGGGVCYGMVTEFLGEGGKNGKIEYYFSNSADLMNQFDLTYAGNPLKKKITYTYQASTASYSVKLVEEYKYKIIKDDIAGFYANSSYPREKRTWGTPVTYVHDELSSSSFTDNYCIPKLLFAGRLRLLSAPLILEKEIKTLYENGQTSADTAVYSYGPNYESLKPVKISYSNSRGQQTIHKLYYPNYLPSFTNYPVTVPEIAAYSNLLANNKITLIGSEKEVGNSLTAKKLTTYYSSGLPGRELLFENGSTLSSETKITQYDGSNIAELEDSRSPVRSFLWDYNNSYLIAEASNAPIARIAYTSFETSVLGGWTLNNGSSIISGGIAGNRSINGGVNKTVPLGNYILSYWSTGTSFVNGQQLTQAPVKTRGGWSYYEVVLNNVSLVNVSGNKIDDVRLFPKEARMVTYTYDPLIGVTSQSDVNNKIAFYEYNGWGQLLRIRDEEQNIIKQLEYQYQDSVVNGVVWQPSGLTRCKPCDLNPAYTGVLQRQEINTNPGITVAPRWVDVGVSGSCGLPDWQNTSALPHCEQGVSGNTGRLILEQKDMNPCSPTAFQISLNYVEDHNACPLPPPTCDPGTCQGEGFKCVENICEYGAKVYFLSNGYPDGTWVCFYRYEWSDGSWSAEYTEVSSYDCMNP